MASSSSSFSTLMSWKFKFLQLSSCLNLKLGWKSFSRRRYFSRFSSPLAHAKKISFMYLNQTLGVKISPTKIYVSTLSMKIQAYGGVNLAVPDIYCVTLGLNLKTNFFLRMSFISSSKSFLPKSLPWYSSNLTDNALQLDAQLMK